MVCVIYLCCFDTDPLSVSLSPGDDDGECKMSFIILFVLEIKNKLYWRLCLCLSLQEKVSTSGWKVSVTWISHVLITVEPSRHLSGSSISLSSVCCISCSLVFTPFLFFRFVFREESFLPPHLRPPQQHQHPPVCPVPARRYDVVLHTSDTLSHGGDDALTRF